MDLRKLQNEFKLMTSSRQIIKGRRLLNKVNFIAKDGKQNDVVIMGRVESENSNATYSTMIDINIKDESIISTKCNCIEYMQNSIIESNYICKHIVAAFLKYIKSTDNEKIKEGDGKELIESFEQLNIPKDTVDIYVRLEEFREAENHFWKADFKIGTEKSYILKDIKAFLKAKNNYGEVNYGKDFVYSPFDQVISEKDVKIVDYMEKLWELDEFIAGYGGANKLIKGKSIYITENSLKDFLKLCMHRNIVYDKKLTSILEKDIPLEIILDKNENNEYVLDFSNMDLKPLNKKGDVFIYEDNIFLPSKNQCKYLKAIFDNLGEERKLIFKEENKIDVFNNIVPTLSLISREVKIGEKIEDVVKAPLESSFYIDSKAGKVILDVKLSYDNEIISFFKDNSKKIIIRNKEKEENIKKVIKDMGFYIKGERFILDNNDEELYKFLTKGCKELSKLGDVYYSERFKSRKVYYMPAINASIKDSGDGFLDFTFNIEDIDKSEYKKIIDAFRNHKRYYKLKNNSFINLENKGLKEFLQIVDNISDGEKDISDIKIYNSKAIIMENYFAKGDLNFIKGRDALENIINKITNNEENNYQVPKELKNVLRSYQVTGFNWFKNLSHLGLGGILADEMGLGKTIQTIAFLLSEKDKKSLIVTPTSLIYNWKNEFEKFAPSLKVAIVHGSKSDRMEILESSNEYDIILTTYGTLRNDQNIYEKKTFDYCIIDEGQNIKNPLARSSRSVKKIKSKSRFALTGTPIENNLIELWSIFDFIMPGYLYGAKKFKEKFIDGEEIDLLQKFIKPFLLRRLKKDVIKELPEKIEKKYYVELPKEQKKVYGVFVKDIRNKVEVKGFNEDKITLFSYLTKLRQLCLAPSLVLDDYRGINGKLEAAIEIVQNNLHTGHKIILFSQFTSVLSIIGKRFEQEGIKYMYLDGSTKAGCRIKLVEEFNNSKENMVFLISLKAGGTGLNLTSADIVIHFDPWWNPSIEEQASDRAHRIGQKNIVQVFKLIAEGTIEEKIINLQENKKKLIENVMGAGYESGNVLSSLSIEEIKELFN